MLVFGGEGIAGDFAGAAEILDSELEPTVDADELERRRIEAGVPRWGRELDDRVLPAEAGLDATHISFSKGCYPGQEPVARLHYRGKANRSLRVLELVDVPEYDAELVHDGKVVGRVTSAVRRPDGSVVALAYVRVEVPEGAAARACRGLSRRLVARPPRVEQEAGDVTLPAVRLSPARHERPRADRAGRRHVAPPARARRVRAAAQTCRATATGGRRSRAVPAFAHASLDCSVPRRP